MTALCALVACGSTSGEDDADAESAGVIGDCDILVGGHCVSGEVHDVCGLDTGYDGDVMCLLEPDAEDGFQMHIGPDEYTEAGMEPWLLEPGEEGTRCTYVTTPNETRKFYRESIVHQRPVSHHLTPFIIDAIPSGYTGGWATCATEFGFSTMPGGTRAIGSLPGTQKVRTVQPTGGVAPPEYADVGWSVSGNSAVQIEMHFVNVTDKPLLREAWINIYYADRSDVKQQVAQVAAYGSVYLTTAPGAHDVNVNQVTIAGDMKVMSLYGHYHAHTTRFSIWRERAGERKLVYEDFDWFDPSTFAYNSVVENPEPDRELLLPGASTGILELQNDDVLYWECEVVNDSDVYLPYANEAYTAEMCNVFGDGIGGARFGDQLGGGGFSRGRAIPIEDYEG